MARAWPVNAGAWPMRILQGVRTAIRIAAAVALTIVSARALAGARSGQLRVAATIVRSVELAATDARGTIAVRGPDGVRWTLPLEQAARVPGVSVSPAGASAPGFVIVTVLPDAPLAPRS